MADDVRYPKDAPLVWPATVTRGAARKGGLFKTATVEAVVPREMRPGERVTVLPLKPGIPALDLPVASAREQPAAAPFPPTWAVAIDATVKSFLAARPERGREKHHPLGGRERRWDEEAALPSPQVSSCTCTCTAHVHVSRPTCTSPVRG